jgi:hypothetical protein
MQNWELAIHNSSTVIYCTPAGGLGNQIVSVIAAGILAVYFNKGIICRNCPGDFFHFPHVFHSMGMGWERFPDIPAMYSMSFRRNDPRSFEMWFFSSDRFYVHRDIGSFLFTAFGEYAIYYIGNHFFRIPGSVKRQVQNVLARIPHSIITIGVQIRTHWGLAAFVANVNRGCDVISAFIREPFKQKPYQVCVASDSTAAIATLNRHFPKMMRTGVEGFPDSDVHSAIIDFCFIQSCTELVLTYRSTFSIMLSALANKTGYYYADEWRSLVKFTTSQLGMTSGAFHATEPFNDKTCDLFRVHGVHEELIRKYYRYILEIE